MHTLRFRGQILPPNEIFPLIRTVLDLLRPPPEEQELVQQDERAGVQLPCPFIQHHSYRLRTDFEISAGVTYTFIPHTHTLPRTHDLRFSTNRNRCGTQKNQICRCAASPIPFPVGSFRQAVRGCDRFFRERFPDYDISATHYVKDCIHSLPMCIWL